MRCASRPIFTIRASIFRGSSEFCRNSLLTLSRAVVPRVLIQEWDVHHSLDVYRTSRARRGTKLPFAERLNRIFVELRVEPSNNLNAIDRAVLADDCVENDLSLHVSLDQVRGILRIGLPYRDRPRETFLRGEWRSIAFVQFRKA